MRFMPILNRLFCSIAVWAAVFAVFCPNVCAQEKADSLSSVSGILLARYDLPVSDATVYLKGEKDQFAVVTGMEGTFSFPHIKAGKWVVTVKHVKFEPYVDTLDVEVGANLLYIKMKTAEELAKEKQEHTLEAATVSAEVEAMKTKGDTVVFNAAAARAMQGDNAMQILEQMPGVSREGGRLQVFGQEVRRTYVNGVLVFGNDPQAALNALLASDVRQFEVYDETSKEDVRTGLVQGRKERVLNVLTKQVVDMAVDAHFLAGAGMDTGKPAQARYALGATANYFSEKLLLYANALGNNIDRQSNRLEDIRVVSPLQTRYQELDRIEAGVEKYWKDRFQGNSLGLSYSYDKSYQRSSERERRQYFPTSAFPSMVYDAEDALHQREGTHVLSFSGTLNDDRFKHLQAEGYVLWDGSSLQQAYATSNTGAGRSYRQAERQTSEDARTMADINLNWDNASGGKRFSQSVGVHFLSDDSGSDILQVDTTVLAATRRYLSADADVRRRGISLSSGFRMLLANGERMSAVLNFGYECSLDRRKDRKTTYDLLSGVPVLNLPNTYDYSFNETEHLGNASMVVRSRLWNLSAGLYGGAARQRDVSVLATGRTESWLFPFFRPFVSVGFKNDFSFNYSGMTRVPALDQLRGRVNDDNSLQLLAGNPDLKAAMLHSFTGQYSKMTRRQESVHVELTVSLEDRAVTPRMVWFDTPGAWGAYAVPAGTTLCTYDNASGKIDLRAVFSYMCRIKPLSGRMTVTLMEKYAVLPQFSGDRLEKLGIQSPLLRANFSGTPSKRVRIAATADLSWVETRKRGGDVLQSYLPVSLSGKVNYQFGTHGFSMLSYAWNGHRFLRPEAHADVNLHNLGALVGWRFCKDALAVSLSGNNLLDSTPSFSTETMPQYSAEHWKTFFCRSVMLNLSYRFNRKGAGASFGGGLRDGGEDMKAKAAKEKLAR